MQGDIALAAEMDAYSFQASAGDRVLIAMAVSTGTLNPKIRLYDREGIPVCQSGSPSGGAVEINDCLLPLTGIYTILANDQENIKTGTYTILANDDGDTETGGFTLLSRLPESGLLDVSPVTVSINQEAATMNLGQYLGSVRFNNSTNGKGNTSRSVGLTVGTNGSDQRIFLPLLMR